MHDICTPACLIALYLNFHNGKYLYLPAEACLLSDDKLCSHMYKSSIFRTSIYSNGTTTHNGSYFVAELVVLAQIFREAGVCSNPVTGCGLNNFGTLFPKSVSKMGKMDNSTF